MTSEQAHLLVETGLLQPGGSCRGSPRLPPLLLAGLGEIHWRRSSHALPGGCSAVAFPTHVLQSSLNISGGVIFYERGKRERRLCFNFMSYKVPCLVRCWLSFARALPWSSEGK